MCLNCRYVWNTALCMQRQQQMALAYLICAKALRDRVKRWVLQGQLPLKQLACQSSSCSTSCPTGPSEAPVSNRGPWVHGGWGQLHVAGLHLYITSQACDTGYSI